ncbi:hypothetical protein DNTS_003274 [Danionella cerebrum]|uniref:Uncharacterized protein n=1 Tax=Danionella cerebrum TaxID=2873325 RepID=A0A553MVI0_9TELE|nr:hypothetical protein DNTS_003274 [Danionella translucida]
MFPSVNIPRRVVCEYKHHAAHPRLSSDGRHSLLKLVGLYSVLRAPLRDLQGGHHRRDPLETRGAQRHPDERRRGHGQTHRPGSNRHWLLEAGDQHGGTLFQLSPDLLVCERPLESGGIAGGAGTYSSSTGYRKLSESARGSSAPPASPAAE